MQLFAFRCILLFIQTFHVASFLSSPFQCRVHRTDSQIAKTSSNDTEFDGGSYESSASLIKGLVSSLTSVSNLFSLQNGQTESLEQVSASTKLDPPATPNELMERIRADYTENNYLWTGKLDTSAFTTSCKFTDPTISFEGIDKYIQNVGNLVPVVEFLLGEEQYSKSKLLEISSNDQESYIETRWNMIGKLNALPWKPKVDVIGRTKFWYQKEDGAVKVYFYDEQWEIPAGLALLQFVTPANTIANSNMK